MNVVTLTDGRLAIRVENPVRLLTVPAMHPQTPHAVRVQVFELVLRRLFGEALDLAQDTAASIRRASRRNNLIGMDLPALIAETPHGTAARAA